MSEMTDWPSIEPFRKLGETLCPHERDTISHGLTIHWAICPRCRYGGPTRWAYDSNKPLSTIELAQRMADR